MSYPGWMCLGGLEIASNARTVSYARSMASECSSGCLPVPGDCGVCWQAHPTDLYVDPVADPAPWFDPDVPESKEFAGFLVTEVTGLGSGLLTRDTMARASGQGTILGRPVQASPVIVVSGLLLASSCCGADYGRRWLSSMLRGACTDTALCQGEDLTFLTCCPDLADLSPTEDPEDALEPYLRTLKGVALVSGPDVVERLTRPGRCGCPLEKVEFTLSASWPCLYSEPTTLAEGVEFIPWMPDTPTCRFHWTTQNCPNKCDQPGLCLIDPTCPPPAPPPRAPAIKNPCTCAPWRPAMGCADIDPSAIPDHAEGIPIITIRSGSDELKHVAVRFYDNPLGLAPEELDPCQVCGAVLLSRIPPDSVFVMDGRDRTVSVTCPGSVPTDASTLLAQAGGRLPFAWPVIECGTSTYTVCVEVDADTLAPNASFDVQIAAREC